MRHPARMAIGPDVRSAQPADFDEIDALLRAAFDGPDEAELVRRLRADGDMGWEVVVRLGDVIAGHVALSRMREPEGWGCLAPLAVLPRFRNGAGAPPGMRGRRHYRLGTRLARYMVDIGRDFAWRADRAACLPDFPAAIVVLGSVPFYESAGFSAARARNLRSPYPVAHTLLAGPGDDAPEATLAYPPAFDGL